VRLAGPLLRDRLAVEPKQLDFRFEFGVADRRKAVVGLLALRRLGGRHGANALAERPVFGLQIRQSDVLLAVLPTQRCKLRAEERRASS